MLPFFSWPSLLTTVSIHPNNKLDGMCSVQQSRSRLGMLAPWRQQRGHPLFNRSKRISALKRSSHRTLCELSDRLLSALGECEFLLNCPIGDPRDRYPLLFMCESRMSGRSLAVVRTQVANLAKNGVPVGPGLSNLQNFRSLHLDTCLPGEQRTLRIPCVFEHSRLAKSAHELSKPYDDEKQQADHRMQAEMLKQAFTTISGLGTP